MTIPTLTTARLTLRGFRLGDAAPLHRLMSEEDVLRYFPRTTPPPIERVEKLVASYLDHWERRGYGLWALELTATGEFMGRCGVQDITETKEVEVDVLLGRQFWSQGYATEAGRECIRYGFGITGADFLVGIVHPEHLASRRVIEKLGFTLAERKEYFGMDCMRYVLKREDWKR